MPFLRTLDEASRALLLSKTQRRILHKRELFIAQGDPSVSVFFMESGSVLAYHVIETGKEVALSYVGPGDPCGLEDAVCVQPYSLSYRSLTSGSVWRVFASDIRMACDEQPALAKSVTTYLASRLHAEAEHMAALILEDLPSRVRKTLGQLTLQIGICDGGTSLPITQSELASLAGASRQRTNSVLASLRRAGILDCHSKRIVIRNVSAFRPSIPSPD